MHRARFLASVLLVAVCAPVDGVSPAAAEEPRSAPRAPLVLEIVSPDGKAIQGATAALLPCARPEEVATRRDGRLVPPLLAERPLASATADANGKVRFEGLAPACYRVVVDATERARDVRLVQVACGVPAGPVNIVLRPGSSLRGTARRKDGSPVAGVTVVAAPHLGPWDDREPTLRFRAATGAEGNYALAGLRDGSYDVWTARDGAGPVFQGTVAVRGATTRDVAAPDGGVLRVRLVAKTGGRPAAGASVEAWGFEESDEGTLLGAGTSDAGGVVEIRLRRERALVETVTTSAAGCAPGIHRDVGAEVADGAIVERTYELRPGASVTGTVVGPAVGPAAPVPGARVRFSRPHLRPWEGVFVRATATTDAAGRFRLDGLPLGAATLHATAEGLAEGDVHVWVRSGEVPDLVLEMRTRDADAAEEPTTTVAGTVLLPDGGPAAGAFVRCERRDTCCVTVSADDGTFSLTGSTRHLDWIRASAHGLDSGPRPAVESRDGTVVRLQPLPCVRGQVRSALGAVVTRQRVIVGQVHGLRNRGTFVDWHRSRGALVRDDGSYELFPPEPVWSSSRGPSWGEDYVVAVEMDGHAPAISAPFHWPPPGEPLVVDLVLDAGCELRGRVVSPRDDAGVAGLPVEVWPLDAHPHFKRGPEEAQRWPPTHTPALRRRLARTQPDGTFVVPHLLPGRYRVTTPEERLVRGWWIAQVPSEEPLEFRLEE